MYMRLKRRGLFRALVGPTEGHVVSGRRLALSLGLSPSFINNMANGKREVCSAPVAEGIASRLGVPVGHLFVVDEGRETA